MTRFAVAATPFSLDTPPNAQPGVDVTLVPGLRLPSIPGLPGPTTPGVPYEKLLGPPKPGSVADHADMAVVKAAQLLRTPEGDAWAVRMAKDGASSLWINLARQRTIATGVVQDWLRAALVAATLGANAAVSGVAKHHFQRDRPYQVDPSIHPPIALPNNSSYPSGHASSAFAAARVIATLEPSLAKEAYSLATQVAVSRVYAGVHYPSDVLAGALLGTAVAEGVLRAIGKGRDASAA